MMGCSISNKIEKVPDIQRDFLGKRDKSLSHNIDNYTFSKNRNHI